MNIPRIGSDFPGAEPEPPESSQVGQQQEGAGYDFDRFLNETPQSVPETNETGPDHSDWPEGGSIDAAGTNGSSVNATGTTGSSIGSSALMQSINSAMMLYMVTFGAEQNRQFLNFMDNMRSEQE